MSLANSLVAVVEDDSSMRQAIERMLRVAGFDCLGFDSAESYLSTRFDVPPDCAVIDVNLGAVSGLTLQAWLATDAPALPVVMITAIESDRVRRVAHDQGCVALLIKPFTGMALIDAIRQGLAHH